MTELAYLQKTAPKQTALLKAQPSDFIVREQLGYDLSGNGEFVALKVRKTGCNTLFVGEKLAQFAGIAPRNMSYAGLKDRNAVTEQWFCLHIPGRTTPDFGTFRLEGVEILQVTRHHRKIRIGSLDGNAFDILLRNAVVSDELIRRLNNVRQHGFPNYFTEQRFGRDGDNLTQARRWASGEINIKDRKRRSFYLSAARSEVFNQVVSARITQNTIDQILPGDILQLAGSHSHFTANHAEDLAALEVRLKKRDILLTAPLIGDSITPATTLEHDIVQQHQSLLALMRQARVSPARRPMIIQAQDLSWEFNPAGLKLHFYLPAGSYATALIRELVRVDEPA
ncbi:tRNA pseudouridine(13) synthase TruD [Necropsobacter massiliensis]|uniref:tRNA pseudouridine(13) synthase TruD n=1 Tax=Necropsobacter massiliensis TaxID=1400001 RepID=UPI000595CDFD|nr:tRNA pseudouridine(13) synthase TruD [Necropsobacter massiliensis]